MELVYETIGAAAGEPLLLIMGLGMQLIHWDRGLCELLAAQGFRVIRFDNRDSGLSTKIRGPAPNVMRLMAGLPATVPYLLDDMAADSFGLLDHLGIERAVIGGMSQGGFVSLRVALSAPERVRALVLLDTEAGAVSAEKHVAEQGMIDLWLSVGPVDDLANAVADLIIRDPLLNAEWIAKWRARPILTRRLARRIEAVPLGFARLVTYTQTENSLGPALRRMF